MIKASILAIGTEITDGQITNSNAQWFSRKLQDLNISVALHLTAPDEPLLIQKTLELATAQSELIFICGGLGPTSDDITRNVLSDSFGLPLELSESTWLDVQSKLNSRNVTVRPAHKQQCYFPQGSTILVNDAGVAPGFYFEHQNKHFWVLPGPPHEIDSIWKHGVHQQLQKHFSPDKHLQLTTWLCLGAPESELAHSAETFFSKYSFAKKLGYRLQAPYVEIKLWHDNSSEAQSSVNEFTKSLDGFFVDTDITSINHKLAHKLKSCGPISIQDTCSSGALLTRLTQILGAPLWQHNFQYHLSTQNASLQNINTLTLINEDDQWKCSWMTVNNKNVWNISSPSNKKSKWREPFLIEKLILEWSKVL